jgi:predicted nucleic acid-binding protein
MGEDQMKVTADSNVLIRAAVQDDFHQARRAAKILAEADLIAVPVPVLCEFVWVLHRFQVLKAPPAPAGQLDPDLLRNVVSHPLLHCQGNPADCPS